MGAHLIDGEFQSDKYPTCPRGKVPLSVKDKTAQDLLWEYAQRRRAVDSEFADDLEKALLQAGFEPQDIADRPCEALLRYLPDCPCRPCVALRRQESEGTSQESEGTKTM